MVVTGGRQTARAAAPLIGLAFLSVTALAGCEVADDVGHPASESPSSARSAAPAPPLPTQDPELAAKAVRNQAAVERILGAPPAAMVMGASAGFGFRGSFKGLAEGTYDVTAACTGTPSALLTISQDGRRDGGRRELNVPCGRAVEASVALKSGPATVQIVKNSTDPGLGAAVGFRVVRRPPP